MISFKISSIGQTEKYNPETEYLGDSKKWGIKINFTNDKNKQPIS